ncbi:MAG: amidohydrolase family protein [Paracoccaceae bacterium]
MTNLSQSPGPVLDTHHHLWKIDRGDYAWMSSDLTVLYRDYLPDDLAPLLRQAGVSKTILVQAADTEAETDFLLDIAEHTDFVAGVCGWLDMDSDEFSQRLARFGQNPYFKSFRPMLQDLPEADWILKPRVLENLAHAADVGCRFEVLTKPPQLPHAIEAIKRTPGLKAVINHISKPDIATGTTEPWAAQMSELRDYPDVYCKLSGMITEADHTNWTPEDLRPYVAHVLDVFGPDRVMFGSDWPVALLAAQSYGDVLNTLRTVVGPALDFEAHRKLFHDNGARFYGLE